MNRPRVTIVNNFIDILRKQFQYSAMKILQLFENSEIIIVLKLSSHRAIALWFGS